MGPIIKNKHNIVHKLYIEFVYRLRVFKIGSLGEKYIYSTKITVCKLVSNIQDIKQSVRAPI